jgi:hypothetical protein
MFHKNEPSQEEKEIAKLEEEIKVAEGEKAPLDEQSYHLHCKAKATTYTLDKDKIMAERAKIENQIAPMRNQIDNLKEVVAIPQLVHLIKPNSQIIKVLNNGNRIEIPEDLNTVIRFDGCGHSLKMPVYELLRYQTTMNRNTQLLSAWEINIRNGDTTTREILCHECLKRNKKLLEERGVYEPHKRAGVARIQIVIFK